MSYSFTESDDPFNVRGKKQMQMTHNYDDLPIPTSRHLQHALPAATSTQQTHTQSAETEKKATETTTTSSAATTIPSSSSVKPDPVNAADERPLHTSRTQHSQQTNKPNKASSDQALSININSEETCNKDKTTINAVPTPTTEKPLLPAPVSASVSVADELVSVVDPFNQRGKKPVLSVDDQPIPVTRANQLMRAATTGAGEDDHISTDSVSADQPDLADKENRRRQESSHNRIPSRGDGQTQQKHKKKPRVGRKKAAQPKSNKPPSAEPKTSNNQDIIIVAASSVPLPNPNSLAAEGHTRTLSATFPPKNKQIKEGNTLQTHTIHSSKKKKKKQVNSQAQTNAHINSNSSNPHHHPFLEKVDTAAKQKRLQLCSKRLQHGHFRDWSAEEYEEFSNQLSLLISPIVYENMFNTDFARVVAAIDFFDEQLAQGQFPAIHAISDLLFKWISSLLSDANPKLLLSLLSFLHRYCNVMHSAGLRFQDAEMANLLPFLIEKTIGHNLMKVRKETQAFLVSLRTLSLYSVRHVLSTLFVGLENKNKRVVRECCECCGLMWGETKENREQQQLNQIQTQSNVLAEMKRGLPMLAMLMGNQDTTVRASALNAIIAGYLVIGEEQLWSILGKYDHHHNNSVRIAEKQMTMIEERIKRMKLDAMIVHTGISTPSGQGSENEVEDECESLSSRSFQYVHGTPKKAVRAANQYAAHHSPGSSSVLPASPSTTRDVLLAASPHHSNQLSVRRLLPAPSPSKVPTINSLSSSLASLELMQASMHADGTAASNTQSSATAPMPLSLSTMISNLQTNDRPQCFTAIEGVFYYLHQHRYDDAHSVLQHFPLLCKSMSNLLATRHIDPQVLRENQTVMSMLSHMLNLPSWSQALDVEHRQTVLHAVCTYAAGRREYEGQEEESCLLCAHTVLDDLSLTSHFSLLSALLLTILLSSSTSSTSAASTAASASTAFTSSFSTFYSTIILSLLSRWVGLVAPDSTLDLPYVLSSLHRLYIALPASALALPSSSPSATSSSMHQTLVNGLHSVLAHLVRVKQEKMKTVMRSFRHDAPILAQLQQIINEQETQQQQQQQQQHRAVYQPVHDIHQMEEKEQLQLTSPLVVRGPRPLYADALTAEVIAQHQAESKEQAKQTAAVDKPVSLAQLLHQSSHPLHVQSYSHSQHNQQPAGKALSYQERFQQLQRQHAAPAATLAPHYYHPQLSSPSPSTSPLSSPVRAIHRTAEVFSVTTTDITESPRRNTTGTQQSPSAIRLNNILGLNNPAEPPAFLLEDTQPISSVSSLSAVLSAAAPAPSAPVVSAMLPSSTSLSASPSPLLSTATFASHGMSALQIRLAAINAAKRNAGKS